MKCFCGDRAVFYRRFEGVHLCREHFLKSVEKRVRKTIRTSKLLEEGDRIAVGISGGKDSLLTLYLLDKIAKGRNIKLQAILIDEGVRGYRPKGKMKAKKFCKAHGILLTTASFKEEYGRTLDRIVKGRKDKSLKACTYCGVFRRNLLNKTARKLKANKLAIGHNLDDEAQSIMANHIRGDLLRQVRIGAKALVVEDKRFIPRIKPLRDIPEKETALYVMLKGINADFSECPYAEESFRWEIRHLINRLEDKYPGTKYSIVRSLDRLLPTLKKSFRGARIGTCKKCKEPSSSEICKVCLLRKEIQDNNKV